jgi:hypothetical protein
LTHSTRRRSKISLLRWGYLLASFPYACSGKPSTNDSTTYLHDISQQESKLDAIQDLFVLPDGFSAICTDPKGDTDHDSIPNSQEGCLNGQDADGDNIPDWLDWDSDNDKISDLLEAGAKNSLGKCANTAPPHDSWPCDTDGDQLPDYIDKDSDGDSILDKDEDKNGDGLLGCCIVDCGKPGTKQMSCPLSKDGCGTGQSCTSGKCLPAGPKDCANGETDPRIKDN